jgi:hypothetical protein
MHVTRACTLLQAWFTSVSLRSSATCHTASTPAAQPRTTCTEQAARCLPWGSGTCRPQDPLGRRLCTTTTAVTLAATRWVVGGGKRMRAKRSDKKASERESVGDHERDRERTSAPLTALSTKRPHRHQWQACPTSRQGKHQQRLSSLQGAHIASLSLSCHTAAVHHSSLTLTRLHNLLVHDNGRRGSRRH